MIINLSYLQWNFIMLSSFKQLIWGLIHRGKITNTHSRDHNQISFLHHEYLNSIPTFPKFFYKLASVLSANNKKWYLKLKPCLIFKNLMQGTSRFIKKDRKNFFEIARGSALIAKEVSNNWNLLFNRIFIFFNHFPITRIFN